MRRSFGCAALAVLALAACTSAPRETFTTLPITEPTSSIAASGTTLGPSGPCATTVGDRTTAQYTAIDGVEPDLLSIDVYPLPQQCGPRPVLFWVHGGGWRVGNKRNRINDKVALAAENGWVLVAINYRLSAEDTDVLWPDHGNDVAAAIGYTLDHADELGIDPERVALMGHSAGGHLAAIVTVDPELLAAVGRTREEIDCLVSLDTEGYDLLRKIDGGSENSDALVTNAFGDDFQTLQQASPNFVLSQVDGQVADALVITRGTARRQAVATDFVALMQATGAQVQLVIATGYTHEGVNDAIGVATDTVVNPPVVAFLSTCLA